MNATVNIREPRLNPDPLDGGSLGALGEEYGLPTIGAGARAGGGGIFATSKSCDEGHRGGVLLHIPEGDTIDRCIVIGLTFNVLVKVRDPDLLIGGLQANLSIHVARMLCVGSSEGRGTSEAARPSSSRSNQLAGA